MCLGVEKTNDSVSALTPMWSSYGLATSYFLDSVICEMKIYSLPHRFIGRIIVSTVFKELQCVALRSSVSLF